MPRQLLQSLDICRLLVIIDSMFSWTNLGRNIQGDSDCWSLSRMRFRLLNFVKSAIQIVDICEEWNSNCWFCQEWDSDCWFLWREIQIFDRLAELNWDCWSLGREKFRLLIVVKRKIQVVDSCGEGNSGFWSLWRVRFRFMIFVKG